MENIRPKIASLSEKELSQLLIDCYFIVGRKIELSSEQLKLFMKEVYKKQGWMYVDEFSEAFSEYAAGEIPDAEKLHPNVSPMFICRLVKLYSRKKNENRLQKNANAAATILTSEGKYKLFVHFILTNKCLPANPDWVSIYEHLAELKKMPLPGNWETLTYPARRRFAVNILTEWACNHFNITETLIYKPGVVQLH